MTEDFLRWFARWVDPNIGRVEQGTQCAAAWAAWRARVTLHPLERLKQVTAERDQARAQYEALLKAIAERERIAATPIDYEAAIHHCRATLGHAQGTKGCIAFARGAEWALAQLTE